MADIRDLIQELGDYGLSLLNMAPKGGHFISVCQLTEGERIKADRKSVV